jgi:hypothetical protein
MQIQRARTCIQQVPKPISVSAQNPGWESRLPAVWTKLAIRNTLFSPYAPYASYINTTLDLITLHDLHLLVTNLIIHAIQNGSDSARHLYRPP